MAKSAKPKSVRESKPTATANATEPSAKVDLNSSVAEAAKRYNEAMAGSFDPSKLEFPPTKRTGPYRHLMQALLGDLPAPITMSSLRARIESSVIAAIQEVKDTVRSTAEDIAEFDAAWGKAGGLPENMVSASWKINRAKEAVRSFFSSDDTEIELKSAVALLDAAIEDSTEPKNEYCRLFEEAIKAIAGRAMGVARAAISSALKGHQYPNPKTDDGHYTPADLEQKFRIDPKQSKNFRKALLRQRKKNLFSDDYRELSDSRENKPQYTFRASAVCDLISKYRKDVTKE